MQDIFITIAEPKISNVVVEKVTFFLVQPHKRRCPKVSDTRARNAPFQGLFPPAVIDWEASWYYHDNLKLPQVSESFETGT